MKSENLSVDQELKITKPDNPGVQFPPPLLYAAFFLAGIFIQKFMPLSHSFFEQQPVRLAAVFFFLVGLLFSTTSMSQFIRTKNTIIPNKAATSLQTTGIYHTTRNPMYVALAMIYLGLTCLFGNWWNIILLPVLLILVQELVIKREEQYLARRFGEAFSQYRQKVRRWL